MNFGPVNSTSSRNESRIYLGHTSRSEFYTDRYKEIEKLPGNGQRIMVNGLYQEIAEDGTDMKALIENYVSVGTVNNVGVAMGLPARRAGGTHESRA